ncbi:MAG: hypothetical protein HQM09_17335 [Candidatus Riflebacteria bacterium]|nr:hypothetical protein [Candidatus Riflebacteria bacterium]
MFRLKSVVPFLGMIIIGAILGCGGGGGGGGGGMPPGEVLFSLTAEGPSGVSFAPSIRSDKTNSILPDVASSVRYMARVTPTGGSPVTVRDGQVDGNTITFPRILVTSSANDQFKVEIFADDTDPPVTDPLFKHYFVRPVDAGYVQSGGVRVTTLDTARAMAYEQWDQSASQKISFFTPSATQLSDLKTLIEKQFTELGAITPKKTQFAWKPEIGQKAHEIGSSNSTGYGKDAIRIVSISPDKPYYTGDRKSFTVVVDCTQVSVGMVYARAGYVNSSSGGGGLRLWKTCLNHSTGRRFQSRSVHL